MLFMIMDVVRRTRESRSFSNKKNAANYVAILRNSFSRYLPFVRSWGGTFSSPKRENECVCVSLMDSMLRTKKGNSQGMRHDG